MLTPPGNSDYPSLTLGEVMILGHSLKLIFVKTKKVGGTSFEIALSKYCDKDDLVTRITPSDEETRMQCGFQGPTNYKPRQRLKYHLLRHPNRKLVGKFFNHVSSELLCRQLGDEIFREYTKLTIHSDPLDVMISSYFFNTKQFDDSIRPSFRSWLDKNFDKASENIGIAPTTGPYAIDIAMRYEALDDDIVNADCLPDDFLETFQSLNAKGNFRDPVSRDVVEFYETHRCEEYIERLEKFRC